MSPTRNFKSPTCSTLVWILLICGLLSFGDEQRRINASNEGSEFANVSTVGLNRFHRKCDRASTIAEAQSRVPFDASR